MLMAQLSEFRRSAKMGKGKGARNAMIKPDDELVGLSFSWSFQDIMNQDLFKDKANTIPDSFSGLKSYLDSFRIPLLEEMRAEMSSNLESLSNHSSTMAIHSLIPRGKGVFKNSFHYSVTVARHRGACSPCIGDIIMLTDAMPRRPAEIASSGRAYCLAHVKNVNARDKFSFEVRASKKIEDSDCYAFPVSLLSFIPYVRIWRCLDHDAAVKKISEHAVAGFLCSRGHLGRRRGSHAVRVQAQRLAGRRRNELRLGGASKFSLIWGPPGTGKTKTISVLLLLLLTSQTTTTSKCRVLTCAPTNTAISQVAARVMALRSQRADGREGGCVGDLLLFGNKERMAVRGDLAEIFLDTRVKRLKQNFSPANGWRHCLVSVQAFLGGQGQ
ncbi:hypothetical protein PR202_gb14580 [Eleusine coracana subsp. coracana]|uniref:DNA2/NAM7 helicase helicase domain-containing protein n=1 Tax=Eleusine coracana subsp. coracana TaxID=191504 RepID=A0AAV5EVP4_ELECO|nr:hypothetical protein PR202_gb14580 [Eleusine coracana subsp. coracana]